MSFDLKNNKDMKEYLEEYLDRMTGDHGTLKERVEEILATVQAGIVIPATLALSQDELCRAAGTPDVELTVTPEGAAPQAIHPVDGSVISGVVEQDNASGKWFLKPAGLPPEAIGQPIAFKVKVSDDDIQDVPVTLTVFNKPAPDFQPQVDYGASPGQVTVTFKNTTPEASGIQWKWSFGDQSAGSERFDLAPVHKYTFSERFFFLPRQIKVRLEAKNTLCSTTKSHTLNLSTECVWDTKKIHANHRSFLNRIERSGHMSSVAKNYLKKMMEWLSNYIDHADQYASGALNDELFDPEKTYRQFVTRLFEKAKDPDGPEYVVDPRAKKNTPFDIVGGTATGVVPVWDSRIGTRITPDIRGLEERFLFERETKVAEAALYVLLLSMGMQFGLNVLLCQKDLVVEPGQEFIVNFLNKCMDYWPFIQGKAEEMDLREEWKSWGVYLKEYQQKMEGDQGWLRGSIAEMAAMF